MTSKEAMAALGYMDGVWRGPASTVRRIGPFLDGAVKLIEGRGCEANGRMSFSPLGILFFDPEKNACSLRSYARGYAGDFPVRLKDDGIAWEVRQANGKIIYTATVKDDVWYEVGERLVWGRDPVRFFEMRLARVDDAEWLTATRRAPPGTAAAPTRGKAAGATASAR